MFGMAESNQSTATPPISGVDAVIKESGAQTYWVRRVVALLIDAIIVFVVFGIVVALSSLPFLVVSGPEVFAAVLGGIFSFLAGFVLILYFVAFEVLTGSSYRETCNGALGGRQWG